MTLFRTFLSASTLAIFAVSIYVFATVGFDFPSVYLNDLMSLDWRSQFDTDLTIALLLAGIWISWREAFTPKGLLLGLCAPSLGFLFICPYLLISTYKANGDPKAFLLGQQIDQ